MIEELRISDLGVIREARVALGPGLTVITGETGAGKTMLLTGIDLLRGGRPDPARVRSGSERAEVEALIAVSGGSGAMAVLDDADVVAEDGAVIVARTVPADGRARARLNGRMVPSATLADLAEHLVAVHGQGEQQRLGRADVQRQVLDRVAGAAAEGALARYRALLDDLRATEAQLADVTTRGAERAAEAQRLRHVVEDLEALAPTAGETAELAAEAERLTHSEALASAAGTALQALADDDSDADVVGLLAAARRALEQGRPHDAALGELADRLGEAAAAVVDIAHDLAAYLGAVDGDPARLDAVHRRRADIAAMERRHGAPVEDLLSSLPAMVERLAELDDGGGAAERLSARAGELRDQIAPVALELHRARQSAAAELEDRVRAELAELAMGDARLEWRVALAAGDEVTLPDGRAAGLGPFGVDEVSLLLASHRDAPAQPLARSASGGELSRVMLALEVVLAGADPVPTMVFDEVDSGVGGRAAVEVGRRLARLARSTQVLVVTHLPQVAAFADQHLVVTRAGEVEVTTSDVVAAVGEARVRELARMLAGLDDSASAADHARELLELADRERSGE